MQSPASVTNIDVAYIFDQPILNRYDFKTEWPPEIEVLFNMYRVAVFFWILIGLVWLSGVISLVTEAIKTKGKSFGSEFSKPQKYTNKINNAKVMFNIITRSKKFSVQKKILNGKESKRMMTSEIVNGNNKKNTII